jgi:hypothetical protein
MGAMTNAAANPEPRTFQEVYADEVKLEESLKAIEIFKRCIENILASTVDHATKRDLIVQCVQEFFEELDGEKE